jgi:hypothetical protein
VVLRTMVRKAHKLFDLAILPATLVDLVAGLRSISRAGLSGGSQPVPLDTVDLAFQRPG